MLDYHYFKKHYKMIAIALSKKQALDADQKATQQINFIGNLEEHAQMLFMLEEVRENILEY